MAKALKRFTVTITDVVDYTATIEAASKSAAYDRAWELFESNERDEHFVDRSETNTTIGGEP